MDRKRAAKARIAVKHLISNAEEQAEAARDALPWSRRRQPVDLDLSEHKDMFLQCSRFFAIFNESHEQYQCASACVTDVEPGPGATGLRTNVDIPPGALLVKEPVLERFLDFKCWTTHCFNCFVPVRDMPIPSCLTPAIVFCSRNCATLDCSDG